jgi:ABC-type nitrate/sulfonate/bicarbonate transport system substrate-binding protein
MSISRRRLLQTAIAAAVAPAFAPRAAAAGVTQLNVGSIGHSIAHFPLYVGAQQGFFQQNGVDIGKVTEFSTGALVGTAVTAGSLDIGSSVITDVFSLAKAGRSVKILSVSAGSYYIDIVASKAFLQSSKLSEKSSIGDKIRAMRGKNIGVTGPGSGTEALVLYLLKLGGIDRTRDVQLVNVGANIPAVLATLRTGRVDLVSFAWPLGQQAQVEDIGETFISPARGDLPEMTHEIQGVVFTTQDEIDKKHAAMVGFVRGYAKACTMILKDPVRTREFAQRLLPQPRSEGARPHPRHVSRDLGILESDAERSRLPARDQVSPSRRPHHRAVCVQRHRRHESDRGCHPQAVRPGPTSSSKR